MKNFGSKIKSFFVNFKKMETQTDVVGYLPNERPSFGKAIVFALQQFLVMLPATVLAAVIMGIYSIPAAIVASGVATIVFLIVTKGKIPLYYGSSFSYIPAVAIIVTHASNIGATSHEVFGSVVIASVISGLMSIGAGLLLKAFGKKVIDAVLPGHVTGMIAAVIGLSLSISTVSGPGSLLHPISTADTNFLSVLVGMITFLAITIFTVVLKKGFISQIPILLGIVVGIIASYFIYVPSLGAGGYFNNISDYINNIGSGTVGLFDNMPHDTFPAAFNNGGLLATAILAILPIAFATIPESAAHVNQIDLYVNDLAKRKGLIIDFEIRNLLGVNLIGDGIGDIVAVMCAGPAGTNYGENVSASAVTKNFSSVVFGITGLLAIAIGFILHAAGNIDISQLLTSPVIKGVSLYLFGAIAVQGIALMIEKKIDVFNPRVIAVMAFIAIVGLGAPDGIVITDTIILPGIGVAAFGGILINALLLPLEKLVTRNKSKAV